MHRHLHTLDLNGVVGGTLAYLLSGTLGALGQHLAEPLAVSHLLYHLHHGSMVTPLHLHAVHIFSSKYAVFEAVHNHSDAGATGDNVHAKLVAQLVQLDYRSHIPDHK